MIIKYNKQHRKHQTAYDKDSNLFLHELFI